MSERQTIKEFAADAGVKMTCKRAASNPHMTDMPDGSNHYRCTLRYGKRSMTTPYSAGPGIKHEPRVQDLLETLASDASGFENEPSFEDWVSEYGFDIDEPVAKRRAKKTFTAAKKQAAALSRLLGDKYKTLLYETQE